MLENFVRDVLVDISVYPVMNVAGNVSVAESLTFVKQNQVSLFIV